MGTKEEIKEIGELLTQEVKNNEIILYNDEVNTFDHVIETLIYACDHSPLQAEQCAWLVHYKGKCTVKTGTYEELEPRCTILLEAGLSAEIV
ncbi:ATP-dependent Clp protease adaptor ClpS [uncultured Planktosalinus sp.]|uniref:ATP-dependent Clp protease adaptor ClpS n=1 Tax=uncultured Planktosalinus sp. TaxID=1810935 RepID=UPI0030D6ED25